MSTDLSTSYLGLELKNPLVVSAGPLCENLDHLKAMEGAGASAIVLHSLFEEQIDAEAEELDEMLNAGTESFAESLSYFPDFSTFKLTPDLYLEHIAAAKKSLAVPIIGSLNGISSGGWIRYAKEIQNAGADALELNIYFIPTDSGLGGADLEQKYLTLLQDVVKSVDIPVAVKLGPWFSSLPNVARHFDEAGAKGLVLFNRFYQPDFDIEELKVVPNMTLSRSEELRPRLRWVAILYGQLKASLAITGGVHSAEDVVKSIMAGADVAMMTSALLKNGIEHLRTVRDGLMKWMGSHDYESIEQMRGSMSQKAVANPAAFERATYLKVLKYGS